MQPYKNQITNFVRQWNFTRSETLALLKSLNDQKLSFTPEGATWQPISYQFSCIGRTQLVYSRAIREGKMDFSWFEDPTLPRKTDRRTLKELEKLLETTNKEWIDVIRERRRTDEFLIKWPGFNQPLMNHITSLIAHERLHHGQLISYFTLAGFELPQSFKTNWAL